ncbi:glycoside hydrolase family 3 N-terminal domain-containing protein [Faecalibacillus intestinalis]|uniref:glycoside hydrolase family 3 N-terminal domain-containing protein n=1 Tax=Faecalibacillus intestinalis TaxID=1982626 RepID=UPI0022E6C53B|nr:glycoside hydrolase family 3 N-terminal domain-containing protein [Faecalibacillus intestinalis]
MGKRMKKVLASAMSLSMVASMAMSGVGATTSKVDSLLSNMSLRQKITQMMMVDFRQWKTADDEAKSDFTKMNSEVQKIVEDYDFGSVIFFANNIKETEQSFDLTMDLQKAATKDNGIPLLITTDQEGGIVYRLGSGTALPGNMALGATGDVNNAKIAGEIIGSELSSLGINTTLAPVVDVNNNANNPVIGLRSYGEDAEMVGKMASAEIEGLAEYNVIGCAKHFPGHGDTATDSHYGLPMVNKSKEELLNNELKPYQVAINQGIEMIMSAHILYPQLDDTTVHSDKTGKEEKLPSTLSHKILTDLLKGEMGFNGVVVTDAMNMAGIAATYDEVQAVKLAINAGVDLICMPTNITCLEDMSKLDAIIDGVEKAVNDGEIQESRLDDAVTRVLTLKENKGILDWKESNYSLEKALATVGCDENRAKEREIAAKAVTVVKNENNTLPLNVTKKSKVLLVAAENNQRSLMKYGVERAKKAGLIPDGAEVKVTRYMDRTLASDATVINADGSTYTSSMTDLLDWCDTLVVVSDNSGLNVAKAHYNNNYTGTPYNLVDYVEKADASKTTVVISANKPYDVQMYPNADAIMAVYGSKGDPTEQLIGGATGSTSASGPNITAGVEVAFGVFGASGKLPVSIPKYVLTTTAAGEVGSFSNEILYDNGYGITYDAKVIDRDTLANRVAELEKLEKGNYTDASWSVFEIALKNAQEVLNKVSSQEDIDEALATLNKAYEALTENKKEEPTNPSDKKDESTNKKDETVKTETKKNTQKSKVKTGDNTAITAFAVMMFISGCVFVLARRKRND